jgi:hypothetical protein
MPHNSGMNLKDIIVVAALIVLLNGCATAPTIVAWNESTATTEEKFTKLGAISLTNISVTPITGIRDGECEAKVELIAPGDVSLLSQVTPLIFAHGFLREIDRHRDWAKHMASWGVPVYLVGLCAGGWNQNATSVFARLLNKTADASGAKAVIYGGFSAGGGASRRAALQDARTVGYLGLDPVARISPDVSTTKNTATFPMFGLFASAAKCNAEQVGLSIFRDQQNVVALEIASTTHCHFEAPSNVLCHAACGEPTRGEDSQALRDRIAALSVGYLRWRAGLDADAPASWRVPQAASLPGVVTLLSQ